MMLEYQCVLVQREMDIFLLQLREYLAFGKEVFLGIREISEIYREMRQSHICETAATTFRRHPSWLSLASCSSAELASVSPTNAIVISSLINVKILFITMLSFVLYVLLWLR